MFKANYFIKDKDINTAMPNNETLRLLKEPDFIATKDILIEKLSIKAINEDVYRLAQFYLNRDNWVSLCKNGYKYNYSALKDALSKLRTPKQVAELHKDILEQFNAVTQKRDYSLDNELDKI